MRKLFPYLGLIFCLFVLWTPLCLAEDTATGLPNPLGDEDMKAGDIIVRILGGFMGILSLFSLVMVIYGGFQYIYSAGNPENLKKAKDTIVWALVGLVIAILSLAIINFVVGAFEKASS